MSTEFKVTSSTLDSSYRFTLSWDFEFDITDPTLSFRRKLEEVPLKGEWELIVERKPEDKVRLSVLHGEGLTEGLFGRAVRSTLELFWVDEGGIGHLIDAANFDKPLPNSNPATKLLYTGRMLVTTMSRLSEVSEQSNGSFVPSTHRSYRFVASFKRSYPDDPNHIECKQQCRAEQKEIAERIAGAFSLFLLFLRSLANLLRHPGLNLEQVPHDVRLCFPSASKDGADLWVKSEILRKSSPYFKSLLGSDFAESVLRRSKRARKSSVTEAAAPPAPVAAKGDFTDSDDETDDFYFSQNPQQPDPSPEAADLTYRQITITHCAFTTYRALLVFLHTGFIHFAPFSSSFPSRSDSRLDFLTSAHDTDPSLPIPVSPKSLYRLAHLLDLDDLNRAASKPSKPPSLSKTPPSSSLATLRSPTMT
jgi:hypothetical protein